MVRLPLRQTQGFRSASIGCPGETHYGTEPQGLLARVGLPIAAVHADKACDSFDSHRAIQTRQAQPCVGDLIIRIKS